MTSTSETPSPDPTSDHNAPDDWVAVARILRPHGLRGTFRLKPLTGNDDDLVHQEIDAYYIRMNGEIVKKVEPDSVKLVGDLVHMKFKGIKDRTQAEVYTNGELVIRESQRWELEEGEFYTDDLKGLQLIDRDSGELVAVCIECVPGVAHSYFIIAEPADLKKTEYLPFIPEFISDVDLNAKTARVSIPEGLFAPPPPPPQAKRQGPYKANQDDQQDD
ncbi:MAG: ribosome maturation factor RimM [Sumerlaeia bacterium]